MNYHYYIICFVWIGFKPIKQTKINPNQINYSNMPMQSRIITNILIDSGI